MNRTQLLAYMRTKTRLITLLTEARGLLSAQRENYLVTGDDIHAVLSESYLMCVRYLEKRIEMMR